MTSKFANQNNRVVTPPSLSRGEISAIHKGIRAYKLRDEQPNLFRRRPRTGNK
jgi:hypothetical protein